MVLGTSFVSVGRSYQGMFKAGEGTLSLPVFSESNLGWPGHCQGWGCLCTRALTLLKPDTPGLSAEWWLATGRPFCSIKLFVPLNLHGSFLSLGCGERWVQEQNIPWKNYFEKLELLNPVLSLLECGKGSSAIWTREELLCFCYGPLFGLLFCILHLLDFRLPLPHLLLLVFRLKSCQEGQAGWKHQWTYTVRDSWGPNEGWPCLGRWFRVRRFSCDWGVLWREGIPWGEKMQVGTPSHVTEVQVLHQSLSSGILKASLAVGYLLHEAAWGVFGPLPYCKSWGLGLASPGAAGFTCHYAHCPGTLTNLHNVGLKKGT